MCIKLGNTDQHMLCLENKSVRDPKAVVPSGIYRSRGQNLLQLSGITMNVWVHCDRTQHLKENQLCKSKPRSEIQTNQPNFSLKLKVNKNSDVQFSYSQIGGCTPENTENKQLLNNEIYGKYKKIVDLLPYNKVCPSKKTQSHFQISSLNTTVFVFQKPNKESR